MVNQRLQPGDTHEASKLPTNVEEADSGGEALVSKIAEGDQRYREEEEAKTEPAQQDGGHHIVRAAFAGRARQHPHRAHDHENAEGDRGDRADAAHLMRDAAMTSAPMKSAPLGSRSWPASVGVNARTDMANDGIRNALPNSAAPAAKLTTKAKGEVARNERAEIEEDAPLGHSLLTKERKQGRGPHRRQPQDAGLLEPVPSAALADDIGEAAKRCGDEGEAEPVKRSRNGRRSCRLVRQKQESSRRQGHGRDAEEYPGPRPGVEQPSLESWSDRSRCDDGSRSKQSLKDRLSSPRIGEENGRLTRNEENAPAKP
jgi:hypothetical protein